jgi:hypothetical protein
MNSAKPAVAKQAQAVEPASFRHAEAIAPCFLQPPCAASGPANSAVDAAPSQGVKQPGNQNCATITPALHMGARRGIREAREAASASDIRPRMFFRLGI